MQHKKEIKINKENIIVILIFILAIISRIYSWPDTIDSVNCDEAMTAINAKAITETGKDMYGTSFPVYFEAWLYGGQSALLTYFMAFCIKIFGFNIKYIDIENIKRKNGKTKWSFKKLFSYAVEGFISFTTAPLKISTILGILTSLIALVSAFIIILQTIIYGKDVPGYASIITAILFMGGVQLLSIGIVSEYISKMYLEIKGRPKYIIKEKID